MYERIRRLFAIAALLAFCGTVAIAQDTATVKVRVSPPEAYIFVDGQPFAHRSQTISLTAGEHTIGVYNYGFVPQVQNVTLVPGRNPQIVARWEAVPGNVTGPWGKIQIEDANHRAAVFLNEMKPEFFVGHVDEMNQGIGPHQKLVVPVGTYQLIVVNPKETQPAYSQAIEVKNNERVIVNVASGKIKYENWHRAGKHNALGRFRTGAATATIAVAPVTGTFSVDKTAIKCGEPVILSWTSSEAPEITVAASPAMQLEPSGQRTENPTRTTTYTFVAKGPGGIVTQTQTVHVDPDVQTALSASPMEVHYRRIDDKVIDPGNATLTWSADNAQQASLNPMGSVAIKGQQTIPAAPTKTDMGTVDEMATYTLVATNNCGGSDKSFAAVHITGTIEPLPVVPLTSIFFPTAYPTEKSPQIGLLAGQHALLSDTVAGFKKFLEYDPDTKLKILAFTDPRSEEDYNMALSTRRGNIVKDALVALGVEESRIEVVPLGEAQQLDKTAVKEREEANGFKRPITSALVHAYNRRVDLVMIPKVKPEQQSKQVFPPRGNREMQILESSAFHGLRTVQKVSAPMAAPSAAGQQ
ncbi:MAG: OmpA family protein [Actinomycetota bacterium]